VPSRIAGVAPLELSLGGREGTELNTAFNDVIDSTTDLFSPFILRRDLGDRILAVVEALQASTNHLSARLWRERKQCSFHFCDP